MDVDQVMDCSPLKCVIILAFRSDHLNRSGLMLCRKQVKILDIMNLDKKIVISLCDKYKVKHLYLFGSATTDNFRPDSDIDLLVTFNTEIPLLEYGDNYFDFKYELEDLFQRKVDLVTERSLTNPYLIESINKNKQLIYERKYKKVFV